MSEDTPIYFVPEQSKQVHDYRAKVLAEMPTLRDNYAMAALTGILRANDLLLSKDIATAAYGIADAMMKERGK